MLHYYKHKGLEIESPLEVTQYITFHYSWVKSWIFLL